MLSYGNGDTQSLVYSDLTEDDSEQDDADSFDHEDRELMRRRDSDVLFYQVRDNFHT